MNQFRIWRNTRKSDSFIYFNMRLQKWATRVKKKMRPLSKWPNEWGEQRNSFIEFYRKRWILTMCIRLPINNDRLRYSSDLIYKKKIDSKFIVTNQIPTEFSLSSHSIPSLMCFFVCIFVAQDTSVKGKM